MALAWNERDYLIAGVLGFVCFVLFVLVITLFSMYSRLNKKVKQLMAPPPLPPQPRDDLASRGFQEYRGQSVSYGGANAPSQGMYQYGPPVQGRGPNANLMR